MNLPVVVPEATVTDDGICKTELLSDSVTTAPPVPAAGDNVTVQVVLLPDAIEFEEQFKDVGMAKGAIVTVVVAEVPFRLAAAVIV